MSTQTPNSLQLTADAHPALRIEDRTITARELRGDVGRCAWRLREDGIADGDRVGLLGGATYAYVVHLLALWELNAVAVPISDRWPLPQVEAAMKRIQARTLPRDLTLPSPQSPSLPIRDTLPSARWATIIFTSGSTGTPKAAVHSHGNHLASAASVQEHLTLRAGHQLLLSLPLYHVGGLAILIRSLHARATLVLDPQRRPLPELLQAHRVTHLSLVPTQLRGLLQALPPPAALAALETVLIGGGPAPPALLREARSAGIPVVATYGCTEMSSQVCTALPEGPPETMRLLPRQELRIAADGEILVRGPTLFQGYLTKDELVSARDADGWYHTGDCGTFADGVLTVQRRRDLMFISGGENIYPESIERELLSLPGVEAAVVVPVRDSTFGERPFAWIRAAKSDPDELNAALAGRLPRFMLPVAYAHLPPDNGLKPDRQRLTDLARERWS